MSFQIITTSSPCPSLKLTTTEKYDVPSVIMEPQNQRRDRTNTLRIEYIFRHLESFPFFIHKFVFAPLKWCLKAFFCPPFLTEPIIPLPHFALE